MKPTKEQGRAISRAYLRRFEAAHGYLGESFTLGRGMEAIRWLATPEGRQAMKDAYAEVLGPEWGRAS
jgi:hypothetical protein